MQSWSVKETISSRTDILHHKDEDGNLGQCRRKIGNVKPLVFRFLALIEFDQSSSKSVPNKKVNIPKENTCLTFTMIGIYPLNYYLIIVSAPIRYKLRSPQCLGDPAYRKSIYFGIHRHFWEQKYVIL